jgi:hypothetical protein
MVRAALNSLRMPALSSGLITGDVGPALFSRLLHDVAARFQI